MHDFHIDLRSPDTGITRFPATSARSSLVTAQSVDIEFASDDLFVANNSIVELDVAFWCRISLIQGTCESLDVYNETVVNRDSALVFGPKFGLNRSHVASGLHGPRAEWCHVGGVASRWKAAKGLPWLPCDGGATQSYENLADGQ